MPWLFFKELFDYPLLIFGGVKPQNIFRISVLKLYQLVL